MTGKAAVTKVEVPVKMERWRRQEEGEDGGSWGSGYGGGTGATGNGEGDGGGSAGGRDRWWKKQ